LDKRRFGFAGHIPAGKGPSAGKCPYATRDALLCEHAPLNASNARGAGRSSTSWSSKPPWTIYRDRCYPRLP